MLLPTLALWFAASEPILHAARVEAAQPERYAAYLELTPGAPVRATDVRHVVELLYATGEAADVVVERTPAAEGGVDLVFRVVPAPLLAAVRVAGDAVLDAGDVRGIARLRSGEPLWPARLETAARDVALHLAGRGYLEAHVTALAAAAAAGSDAVFTIAAGPRARVAACRVEGLSPSEAVVYEPMLRPGVGEPYERARAEDAARAVVKGLREAGRLRATVEPRPTYDPARGTVELVFTAVVGPFVGVEFTGARPSTARRHRVLELLREGGVSTDVLEETTELLEDDARRGGHREARVSRREESRTSGVAIVYDVRSGPKATIASVRVAGAPFDLDRLVNLRSGAPVEDRTLDETARVLTRALEDDGYASAHVEAEVPEGGGMLPVVFRVRPGPRTIVTEVAVDLGGADTVLAPHEARVTTGRPYRARDVALERADLVALLRNAGYLQGDVAAQVSFTEGRAGAAVHLQALLGPRTTVDHVVISGLVATREPVVRRELLVHEGEPLGLQRVLESQRRLAALGIFESVSIDQMDPESVDKRSLVVHATEGRRTTLAYGLGYAEEDRVRGSVEVTRKNLGGLDRSLSTFLRASARGNRVLTTYSEPYLFGHKQALFVTAFREQEDRPEEGFDFNRYGGIVQTARSFAPHWNAILRYTYQRTHVFNTTIDLSEVDRQFRDSTTSGPSASVFEDARDDPIDPRRGHFVGADVQLSSRVLGGDGFAKGFLQASGYRRLAARATLAVNGQLGLAHSIGYPTSIRLPLPDRFFAGGDYSLRGFKLDTAGPLEQAADGTLVPTGGNALVLGSAELRVDVGGHFAVAAFTDIGNVFPLVSDFDLGDLRYTAGLGVRYRSALGPLRLDWGYKLNRRGPQEAPYRFHITIGNAF